MKDLVVIDSKKAAVRIVLAFSMLAALAFAWFAVRWQLGNMLASISTVGDPNSALIADLASGWAPTDPASYWLKAAVDDTVETYEHTVRLAPYDYRWRVQLGRSLVQNDQLERAEIEFKRAVELAPGYAIPHWHLGNFYLRQNRIDEAIAELREAARNNQPYRDQVFSLAWDYFGKDAAQIERLAGDTPDAHARLAYFFAARGRGTDALRNWNMLTEAEKAANPVIAKNMAHGLYIQRYFPQALEFSRQIGFDADAKAETVTDGSFEKGVNEANDSRFGWQIVRNDPKLDISGDSKVKRDGNRSLRFQFRNFVKPVFNNLFQTVVVQPSQRYRLTFWVRTENLKSGGLPLLDVVNANDDKLIARSEVFPNGTNEWQQMAIEFAAPENCTAISLRTTRLPCGEDCPVAGTLWYDDFELSRM